MKDQVRVALVGVGGYGESYIREILKASRADFKLVGAADPSPEKCSFLGDLKRLDVPVYPDLETLLKSQSPDLTVLSTPIHLHARQSALALSKGSSVLCEKPLAGSVAEAQSMIDAEKASGGLFLAIGYQWSFSKAVLDLKADVMGGVLGRPVRLRSLLLWPRTAAYYGRSKWAGAKFSSDGSPVMDSPANNATAHYLHNCLYILGDRDGVAALPKTVEAELYRANRIENFDTAAIRCVMECGAEILFYTTHACPFLSGPALVYEFERATVLYDRCGCKFVARFKDGSQRIYGDPESEPGKKLWDCVEAVKGGPSPVCRAETAAAHTRCIEAIQKSGIADVPKDLIEISSSSDPLTFVKGIQDAFTLSFGAGLLPSETGCASWARKGVKTSV